VKYQVLYSNNTTIRRAGAVSEDRAASLSRLIDNGNAEVGRIFHTYEEGKDVQLLINSLQDVDGKAKNNDNEYNRILGDDDDDGTVHESFA
jgi:hypothetical protein